MKTNSAYHNPKDLKLFEILAMAPSSVEGTLNGHMMVNPFGVFEAFLGSLLLSAVLSEGGCATAEEGGLWTIVP